jgi:hypothetical protein
MTVTLFLIAETDAARKFQEEPERGQIPRPRQFWVPRSVCKSITKMPPQLGKPRECIVDIEDWFAEKAGLA